MKPHVDRPLVYVAGPYTVPDPVENTHDAILVAEELHSSGLVTACVPHLNFAWHIVCPHPADYWYEYDLSFLSRCNALLRIPGESVGADNEVAFANERGIPVFHSIATLMEWARNGN